MHAKCMNFSANFHASDDLLGLCAGSEVSIFLLPRFEAAYFSL